MRGTWGSERRELKISPGPASYLALTENFDEGWDNWVGGVADWKVDVAGVRIGSLAIYLPTLEMSDGTKPALFRCGDGYLYLVMPLAG